MKRLFNIFVLISILCCFSRQKVFGQDLYDFPDVHVFPSPNSQSEVHISVNPANSNNLVLSCNTYPDYHSQGYFYSTDGASVWNGSENLQGYTTLGGDPSSAFDANGNAYISTLSVPFPTPHEILMQSSNDGGANWNNISDPINNTSGIDKDMITCDNYSTSPFHNNLYCGWTYFDALGTMHVMIDHSTNAGLNFTNLNTLNRNGQGVNIQSAPNGNVYAVWADFGTGISPQFPASGVGFSSSTNGGQSFSTPRVAFNYTGIDVDKNDPDPSFNNIRVNDFPSMAVDKSCAHPGRIYVVYPAEVSSKAVIQLRYSNDAGANWSSAITVSKPAFQQSFFPWVTVDNTNGDIYVDYYAFDQTTGFNTDVYVAYSNNGGTSFQNIKVSDVSFTTQPINNTIYSNGYMGDYIGIAASSGQAWAAWMDDRNGTWQIYVSKVSPYGIVGPSNFCSSATYSISNLPANATVTWSASPSGIVSLSPNGNQVTATKIGNGDITLTANIATGCGTYSRSKYVDVGLSGAGICYLAHDNLHAYIFTYNKQFASPPTTYFEMQSLNSVPIYPWPPHSNQGLPPSTLYDVYGVGISVPSGTAEVRARYYTNECGWSGWSETFYLAGESYFISPNPAQNMITIVSNSENNNEENKKIEAQSLAAIHIIKQVKIYNASGNLIKQQQFSGTKSRVQMDISRLTNGVYFVEISDGKNKETQKLVINR